MPGAQPPPFRADGRTLAGTDLVLAPVAADDAVVLGQATAAMEPWRRYGFGAAALETLFRPASDGGERLALRSARGEVAAAIVIRPAWLAGPYVQFLVVLPAFQGRGLGSGLLAWVDAEARRASARNLWICTSAFNDGAARLYRRHGFEDVAILHDLVRDGIGERLMRKRLLASPSGS